MDFIDFFEWLRSVLRDPDKLAAAVTGGAATVAAGGAILWLAKLLGFRTGSEREVIRLQSLYEETVKRADGHAASLDKSQSQVQTLLTERAELQERIDDLTKQCTTSQAGFDQLRLLKQSLIENESDLWTFYRADRPLELDNFPRQQPRVIVVTNQKGGVGKSTLATSLAAYYNQVHGKRALIVDFDFQASTSILAMRAAEADISDSGVLKTMLGPENTPEQCISQMNDLNRVLPGSKLAAASFDFAKFENRMMLRWLFKEDNGDDARFRFAQFVNSSAVKDRFDIVIVDTGPRLTAATVAALAGAHYFITPTLLDRMSVEATANHIMQVRRIFIDRAVSPSLRYLGAVPMMVRGINSEKAALTELSNQVRQWDDGNYLFDTHIKMAAAFSNHAGLGFAYLRDRDAKNAIDSLGSEIEQRMGHTS